MSGVSRVKHSAQTGCAVTCVCLWAWGQPLGPIRGLRADSLLQTSSLGAGLWQTKPATKQTSVTRPTTNVMRNSHSFQVQASSHCNAPVRSSASGEMGFPGSHPQDREPSHTSPPVGPDAPIVTEFDPKLGPSRLGRDSASGRGTFCGERKREIIPFCLTTEQCGIDQGPPHGDSSEP
ncbi:hypothetical protein SKAU_G00051520 [Synaphobranchus kaupii]|uniref:Uncharacterized protein n=1 Tax=Synaphobranchus kaupii TaxID=118154 RepID=A0A9Q1G351_SYNKA|nr:hypothetical protein SKAU_G00051520 [Synaphobranchus kaupii]